MPSVSEVAAEVGLARPSVYAYITSKEDLLIQLLLKVIPQWLEELEDALAKNSDSTRPSVITYVDVTLDLFLHGSHGPLMIAAGIFPQAFADPRVQEAHDAVEPARQRLIGGSAIAFSLIDAAIARGSELIGQSPEIKDEVVDCLHTMAKAVFAL